MSKICQITGKKAMVGNNVSHSKRRTKRKFDVNLLLIRRNNISINPKANDEILPGDELFVIGKSKNITELGNYLKQN